MQWSYFSDITDFVLFQECNLALARHQNVHLLQVERLICEGGPWACPLLKAILSDSSLPQNEGWYYPRHNTHVFPIYHVSVFLCSTNSS